MADLVPWMEYLWLQSAECNPTPKEARWAYVARFFVIEYEKSHEH